MFGIASVDLTVHAARWRPTSRLGSLCGEPFNWANKSGPTTPERSVEKDFTQAQLFACLAVRERMQLSYRKAEAFFIDVPDWLGEIQMTRAPDHNTLWRAFGKLLNPRRCNRALDMLATEAQSLDRELSDKPLSIDSTCFEPHHRSSHYDRVCRRMLNKKEAEKPENGAKK